MKALIRRLLAASPWSRALFLCAICGLVALAVELLPAASAAQTRRATGPSAAQLAEYKAARLLDDQFRAVDFEDALAAQPARLAARLAALPPHRAGAETFVLAVGGDGYQRIFDREARRAAEVLGRRSGGPALVLSNSPEQLARGLVASPRTVGRALAGIGKRLQPGDTLLVYLASHGGEAGNIAMAAPRLDFPDLTAAALAQDLKAAGIARRVVIVSACFGATWIKPLASPTTIVVTAAAADRTSFGCDDRRDLTVFGEAMLGELAKPGRSLATAFANAKTRIAAVERAERQIPSLPQSSVGTGMAALWTAKP